MEPRINAQSKQELVDLAGKCMNSTENMCTTFFPHIFYRKFGLVHQELFETLDDKKDKKVVITAFRGIGKTSIMRAFAAKELIFENSHFVIPLGCSYTHAEQQSENLKKELTQNVDIKKVFGSLKDKNQFAKDHWKIKDRGHVLPRGSGQQMRGLLIDWYRPDLLLGDDLENPEFIESEEQRKKVKTWLFADVLYVVDLGIGGQDWRAVITGTILHEDSLLLDLMDDPDWHHIDIPLCDDKFKSVWPGYMTDDMVLAEMNSHRRKGTLDIFYRERMNKPIASENRTFPGPFTYYKQSEPEMKANLKLEHVVLVDPAKTVKMESAETGIVGVSLNVFKHRIYVRDCIGGKFYPDEMYDHAINMAQRIGARVIGVEVTSLHEFITQPFRNTILKRGLHYELVELHARGKKEDRVRALAPYYRQGEVEHHPLLCGGLEGQLLAFPRSKRWDIMDALAYIVEMMDIGGRYFTQYEDESRVEEEYIALEREDEREARELKKMEAEIYAGYDEHWRQAP